MIIFITIFTTLSFLLIIYSFYYFLKLYYKKNQQFLLELEDINLKHKQEILTTQIEIQEQTFENISREIHDNIGQKLSLAKLHMNTLKSENDLDSNEKFIAVFSLITAVIIDLGDISRSMSADFIQNNGLVKAVEFEVKQLKKLNKYDIQFIESGDSVFLENQKELIIFRVLQEALNNIIKHSNCTIIKIWLTFEQCHLELCINDNGNGFNVEQKLKQGNGLGNMKKRSENIHAAFKMESKPDFGTTITIKIPYDEHH